MYNGIQLRRLKSHVYTCLMSSKNKCLVRLVMVLVTLIVPTLRARSCRAATKDQKQVT